MASLLSTAVLLSGLAALVLAAPTGHTHPDTIETEAYVLTAILKSGQTDNPTWSITDKDRASSKNINTIAKAIDWYSHNNDKPQLASVSGYQGFLIDHVINGNSTGVETLPRCRLPNLEKALVEFTSGNSLSVYQKKMLLCILQNCKAKSIPAECYKQ